jgi:endonuclease/exonuclease/phosphatase family metal-dependent hydrolase
MEWLVSPATAHAARLACRSGRRATLPCDVARAHSRDSADFGRLAAYARQLDADVIAFQEVQDAASASLVFGDYRICIATGRGLQHAGFAVRPGIAHRCGPQVDELSLGGSQRAGMTLMLQPDTPQAIELLSVHLKSGCADADLESGTGACTTLSSQARQLAQWISARAGSRFILLGDFNRGDADVAGDAFWRTLAGDDPAAAPFVFANEGVPFRNCHIGAGFTRAIDHILVSRALHAALVRRSFRKPGFRESDVLRYRLTDHCPVSFLLDPEISSAAER